MMVNSHFGRKEKHAEGTARWEGMRATGGREALSALPRTWPGSISLSGLSRGLLPRRRRFGGRGVRGRWGGIGRRAPRARAPHRAAGAAAGDRAPAVAAVRAARAGPRAGPRARPRGAAARAPGAHPVVPRVEVSVGWLGDPAGEALGAGREVVRLARVAPPVPGLPAVSAPARTAATAEAAAEAAAARAAAAAAARFKLARGP